jgi:hypothetical protein
LRRYIKYSKNYKRAIACFVVVIVSAVVVGMVGAALFTTSPSDPVLGMNRTTATLTFLFAPSVTCAALLLGVNFWFNAEGNRLGWYGLSEESG